MLPVITPEEAQALLTNLDWSTGSQQPHEHWYLLARAKLKLQRLANP